ncbi:MAG: hypothetical protein H6712_30250 [Myxococcales bacterium]|nr:hypothetical protein [Myxococcales bacterium]MCB9718170.1 hypothetical protein [Myxococcales bacterium]
MEYQVFGGLKLRKSAPELADDAADAVVQPRRRDDTAPRRHVFLRQTMPPSDPVVLEVERRRSGAK